LVHADTLTNESEQLRSRNRPAGSGSGCDTRRVDDDYHPELANYEPYEPRPLRSRRSTAILRGVVILAVVALVLPGIITAMSFADATAQRVCQIWVAYEVNEQNRPETRFEVFGPGFAGWECYAITATGEQHIKSLGLIPESPQLPDGTMLRAA